jgi:O-acetyl-ADP-ribose deacetylase
MAELQLSIGNCTIELIRGDITSIPVDAIVNAANHMLAGGGGVDGAIHAVGGPTLMQELQQYDCCPTGSAVVTGAGLLPAKYVFHAVGPVYRGGDRDEAPLLASCYRTVLQLAQKYKCERISLPSISTGVYGYPIDDAAAVAFSTIEEVLPAVVSVVRNIKLVQFSEVSYSAYSKLISKYAGQPQSSVQTS